MQVEDGCPIDIIYSIARLHILQQFGRLVTLWKNTLFFRDDFLTVQPPKRTAFVKIASSLTVISSFEGLVSTFCEVQETGCMVGWLNISSRTECVNGSVAEELELCVSSLKSPFSVVIKILVCNFCCEN